MTCMSSIQSEQSVYKKSLVNFKFTRLLIDLRLRFAEREGFEPPVPCSTMVFKTTAFDHSAISPDALQK